jgi:hypothetical protein
VDEGLRSVIIRTPDQRVNDLEVTCQPRWTVANLKQHLSLLYPGNPVSSVRCRFVKPCFFQGLFDFSLGGSVNLGFSIRDIFIQ